MWDAILSVQEYDEVGKNGVHAHIHSSNQNIKIVIRDAKYHE